MCYIYHDNKIVATGYINKNMSLAIRILQFKKIDSIENFIFEKINALKDSKESLVGNITNSYRLINAENDNLPGIIVDKFDNYFVIQSSTSGSDNMKIYIINAINKYFSPLGIIEKSNSNSRKSEHLQPINKIISGEIPDKIVVKENNLKFVVDLLNGQKTGYFLDQRYNRKLISDFSKNKTILNTYSYSSMIGVYAKLSGAKELINVDISSDALELGKQNYNLNNVNFSESEFVKADVKKYLKNIPNKYYDIIILDPPKFAASKRSIDRAIRGYTNINQTAFEKIKPNGIIFTFSCSGLITRDLFQKMIFKAAKNANRDVKILKLLSADIDHSVSIFHREGEYLKGYVLLVE